MEIELNFNHPTTKLAIALIKAIDSSVTIKLADSGNFIIRYGETSLTDPYQLWEYVSALFNITSPKPPLLEKPILRELFPSIAHLDFKSYIIDLNSLYSENILSLLVSDARMMDTHIKYMVPSLVHNTRVFNVHDVKLAVCNVPKWYVNHLYEALKVEEPMIILLTYIDIPDTRLWSIRCPQIYYNVTELTMEVLGGGGGNGAYGFKDPAYTEPTEILNTLLREFS